MDFSKVAMSDYNLHTLDVREYLLQSFDKVEQWKINKKDNIYYSTPHPHKARVHVNKIVVP